MTTLHKIQITILQRLLYSDGLKYAQIKPPKVVGSKFTFHLSQLSKFGYITKNGILYKLTFLGKELANRMDLGDERVKVQAKISAIMACIKGDQYLLYTRQKSPFYGYQGFPTGKVKYGEDIAMAAKRELKEETGLTGNPTLSIIRHYKIYDKKKNLLEDKIFFVYKFINPKGTLRNNPEGKYKWVDTDKVWDYLKKPVKEIKEILESLDNKNLSFLEKSYVTRGF